MWAKALMGIWGNYMRVELHGVHDLSTSKFP